MSNDRNGKKKKRDRVGVVLYTGYLVFLGATLWLIAKLIWIQVGYKPDPRIKDALTPQVTTEDLDPLRGNIVDCKGRILAMSCPIYEIHMDCTVRKSEFANAKREKLSTAKDQDERDRIIAHYDSLEQKWLTKARALSAELTRVYPEKTADEFYRLIKDGRENNRKYVKLGEPVDRNTYKQMLGFPLFDEGSNKGGLIVKERYVRRYPYGELARRTIGFVRNNTDAEVTNNHVGIEGKFDYVLHGRTGHESFRTTDAFKKIHDNDSSYVQPRDGQDVHLTLDVDFQELADKALRAQLDSDRVVNETCLVLMEVRTGAIKAMVNLKRNPKTGAFEETQNVAIGHKAEPGSVFKTVTLMSVLNDKYIKDLDTTLPATNGKIEGTSIPADIHIPDFARQHGTNRISVIDGFKISSNYVYGTLAVKYYTKHSDKFFDHIYEYKLGDAFDFDLDGLAKPTIPARETEGRYKGSWTPTTLGSVGYGYATEETPLHILTFYNAIANKGKSMKPYLVESLGDGGSGSSRRGPSVLNSSICSPAVADTLNRALMAVTSDGTAKWSLRGVKCNVAGKTGTSFGTFPKDERGSSAYEDKNGRRKYQGTFVGYFPAESPKYSVICSIYTDPVGHSSAHQGGGIPAKAVKMLIDGIFNIDPELAETVSRIGKDEQR